jgi:hypothetical protein
MTRVKWFTQLKTQKKETKNKTSEAINTGSVFEERLDGVFQLNHFDRSIPFFKIACKYSLIEDLPEAEEYNLVYRIDVCLKQMESQEIFDHQERNAAKRRKVYPSKAGVVSTDKVAQSTPHNMKRPCSVWLNFNRDEKKLLKVNTRSVIVDGKHLPIDSEWTEQFIVKLDPSYHSLSVPLICVFWMKFANTDHGEMNVVKHLTNLFVRQSSCDVQFYFKGGFNVGGHATILAARSPVFAAMFQHDMREKKTGKVVIEDINPIIFNDLLHYIYSGRIPSPLNEKTAQLMFMAADKYNIDDLKEYCVTFLLSQMQATNALDLLIWAHLNSIEKIKEASLNFVAANGKVIFQTSEWEKIITAHPDLCLLVTRRV